MWQASLQRLFRATSQRLERNLPIHKWAARHGNTSRTSSPNPVITPDFSFASATDTMSAAHVSPQEMSEILNTTYCVYAACVILVYDWLLCLDQEVRYIWKWRSGVTVSTLVYACSRYGMLLHNFLVVATVYPMSDLSCAADVWAQVAAEILSMVAFSAFSALRAYALSNRSVWLTALIILLVLPPVAIFVAQGVYQAPLNLPSPFNCSTDSSLPPALSGITITMVTRVSQLATEVLVVALTWWYGYRAYRVRRGTIDFRKSLSSLIVYNGSIYFLFLATLYTLDIIFQTASVPATVVNADNFMQLFYDPITSILVSHFMLSLRQFDSNMVANATDSGTGFESGDHTTLTVLQFGARPSESLPALIASFAHPVHVGWSLSETDSDGLGDDDGPEWREMDTVATTLSCDGDHRPEWEHSK